jgi:hypothetical protein
MFKRKKILIFIILLILLFSFGLFSQTQSPEEFFGFKMGSDCKLARYDKIVEYFHLLEQSSDKIQIAELGKTTNGNPFIMAIISSAANLKDLDKYKRIQRQLANPDGLSAAVAKNLIAEAKTVALINCNQHSTEIGSSQMAVELAYKLITENSPKIKKILDEVIFLLIPSLNPDGQIMVVDWYNKYLGTPFEGGRMPWLYHKYVGHDNNRDHYMLTQKETKIIANVLYKEWFPQILLDQHQMGNKGPRLFIPPFADPANPNVDSIILREVALIGSHMATSLEQKGYSGVGSAMMFTAWWEGGLVRTPWWHNIVGLLSEAASVKIASPIFQKPQDLSKEFRALPGNKRTSNFPNPWSGGWWRLRNIVDYELVISLALLEVGARYRDSFLNSFYLLGKKAIESGKTEPPYAYIIPPDQHDNGTATLMLQKLMESGVRVHKAQYPFRAKDITFPQGTYVILMAQPYRNYIKDLLEIQRYPDMRLYPEGPPIRPYDLTGWTLPLQMGVNTIEVNKPFEAELVELTQYPSYQGKMDGKAGYAYLISAKANNSYIAINRLLNKQFPVYRSLISFNHEGKPFPPGTIITPKKNGLHSLLEKWTKELQLDIKAINTHISIPCYKLKNQKIGLYQPWTANTDEGWTRWILEQYEFPYETLHNADIQEQSHLKNLQTIILPDMRYEEIIEGNKERTMPPQYCGGLGIDGIVSLKTFVKNGGTLICLDSSAIFAIKCFGLPVKNVLEGLKPKEFFCPGSLLDIEVDNNNPLAFGMPSHAIAVFSNSPAFEVLPSFQNNPEVIAKYPEANPLRSGWLIGETKLLNKAAVINAPYGKGNIILAGFRVQNRAQPHNTFKILFNSIFYGASSKQNLP